LPGPRAVDRCHFVSAVRNYQSSAREANLLVRERLMPSTRIALQAA
jgi:hypothetical protein